MPGTVSRPVLWRAARRISLPACGRGCDTLHVLRVGLHCCHDHRNHETLQCQTMDEEDALQEHDDSCHFRAQPG